MRALVTGASGFLGRHIVGRLSALGWVIMCTGRRPRSVVEDIGPYDYRPLDIRDCGALVSSVREHRPDVMVHLAAVGIGEDRPVEETAAVNVGGTLNVLEAARRVGVPRAIIAGSYLEYGQSPQTMDELSALRPEGLYATTKASSTLLALAWGKAGTPRTLVLRLATLYGPAAPAGRLLESAVRAALTGQPLVLRHPGALRDYVYVEDAAEAFALAAGYAGELESPAVLNIATGILRAATDILSEVEIALGRPVPVEGSESADGFDAPKVDVGRAKATIGWKASTPLQQGIRKVVRDLTEGTAR